MRKDEGMQQYCYSEMFEDKKEVNKLDEQTFSIWKSELQKELPLFWESMR